jgi:peptidoglycan-associated lipoprotein
LLDLHKKRRVSAASLQRMADPSVVGAQHAYASAGMHQAIRNGTMMNIRLLGAVGAFALLAACSHTPPATTGGTGGTGMTMNPTNGVVPGSQEDLVANVGDRVFYVLNASTLSDDAQATLSKQAAWLEKYPNVSVQVAGNCDDRGTEEYNIALGQRRANAARDYLVAKGVSSSRITTISYGKDRPTALGDDEQAWSQNRNAITSVK